MVWIVIDGMVSTCNWLCQAKACLLYLLLHFDEELANEYCIDNSVLKSYSWLYVGNSWVIYQRPMRIHCLSGVAQSSYGNPSICHRARNCLQKKEFSRIRMNPSINPSGNMRWWAWFCSGRINKAIWWRNPWKTKATSKQTGLWDISKPSKEKDLIIRKNWVSQKPTKAVTYWQKLFCKDSFGKNNYFQKTNYVLPP